MIVRGELTSDISRITYDEVINIIDSSEFKKYEDILRRIDNIHGAPDYSGGSGITRVEYWLDDKGNEKISMYADVTGTKIFFSRCDESGTVMHSEIIFPEKSDIPTDTGIKDYVYRVYNSVDDEPVKAFVGDIDGSGNIDVTDLTELSLALLGDRELTDDQQKAADVDGDGAVTLADLARLRQYLSKKIDSLTDAENADSEMQETDVKYSAAISVRVTDNKLDEYPQHSIIEDRAGFEALYNEKQSLEIEKTGFYSGGIFPILNEKYTDEWFETHKLYVAYPGKGGPTGYRYNVESVTNKAVTIYWDQLGESESRTENKADWIILIEVAKDADVTEKTEIKFHTVF